MDVERLRGPWAAGFVHDDGLQVPVDDFHRAIEDLLESRYLDRIQKADV